VYAVCPRTAVSQRPVSSKKASFSLQTRGKSRSYMSLNYLAHQCVPDVPGDTPVCKTSEPLIETGRLSNNPLGSPKTGSSTFGPLLTEMETHHQTASGQTAKRSCLAASCPETTTNARVSVSHLGGARSWLSSRRQRLAFQKKPWPPRADALCCVLGRE
jgi:hypothetical protein